jgi:CheY-like chemotaxis protein
MTPTILVVEDEPVVLEALQEALGRDEVVVVSASTSEDALAAAQGVHPAIFVIDLMLPGESGIELAEALREGGFADTPMIGVTGSPLMADVAEESSLFQEVQEKPLDFELLVARVAEYLGV